MATTTNTENGATLSVRVTGEELEAIDALVGELTEQARGVRITRSDVARRAIALGIDALKKPKR